MKKLVIHMGIHKTGSSALQFLFAQNRDYLKKEGIIYPKYEKDLSSKGHVCSGNGGMIGYYFTKPLWKPKNIKLEKIIKSWLKDDAKYLIFSSEEIYLYIDNKKLERLKNLVEKNGSKIEFIFYLRSMAGYTYSYYNQMVRAGYDKDMSIFINDDIDKPYKTMLQLNDMGFDVVARNYDTIKCGTEHDFFNEYLRVNLDELDISGQNVNTRTLSKDELNLFIELNKKSELKDVGDDLRSILLDKLPATKVERTISKKDYQALRKKCSNTISRINQEFPDINLDFDDPKVKKV